MDQGSVIWLNEMADTISLLTGVLKIIHPELYLNGLDTLTRLYSLSHNMPDSENIASVLSQWSSAFNAISVISNRTTPIHRDTKSRAQWYDLLLTIGPYSSSWIELPGLGLRFSYDSGTVVCFPGRILAHGVPDCDGERVCYAFYMREALHARAKVGTCGWPVWGNL